MHNCNLQTVKLGQMGRQMCEGEFESLKAIYEVSPGFVPKPYAWGKLAKAELETYFLLVEFRDIGRQVIHIDTDLFTIDGQDSNF